MQVSKPNYIIQYNGKNITTDISASLLSLNYTDKVTGEADEMEITLEDKFGRWQNEWYPEKGSFLTVSIGIESNVLDCGIFQIDEIEFSGPPDQVIIKALSTGFYGKKRNKKGWANENKTLSEIVRGLAAKLKLTVVGTIENVRIGRSTQFRESDMQYLARLASQYGYNFTVKDKKLIFIKQTELEARNTSVTVDKTEVTTYGFKDKTAEIFKGTEIKFHNPNTNKTVTAKREAKFVGQQKEYTDQLDTLEIRGKTAENEEQANLQAEAQLHRRVGLQQTGSFTTPGNTFLIAGNNIDLTGFGYFSGIWHILNSTHSISDAGYETAVEIKRVNTTSSNSKKLPKKSKNNNTNYNVK